MLSDGPELQHAVRSDNCLGKISSFLLLSPVHALISSVLLTNINRVIHTVSTGNCCVHNKNHL